MAEKSVTFYAPRYSSLELIHTPRGMLGEGNRKIKPIIVTFSPNNFGVGVVVVSDPKLVDWVRKHDYFRTGKVTEAEPEEPVVGTETGPVMKTGPASSEGPGKPKAPAPAKRTARKPAGKKTGKKTALKK